MDAILVGLEKTACLIDRCTIYEFLYTNGGFAASKTLEKSILRLYTAILKFLAKCIEMLNGGYFRIRLYRLQLYLSTAANSISDNHLMSIFTGGISNYLEEVEQLEKTVGQDASVAEAQCIIQPVREKLRQAKLTLCRFPSGVREASDAAGRYQHDNVTARTSNRQYTTKSRRYVSAYKIFPTHTAVGSKRSAILKMDIRYPVHEPPRTYQRGAPRRLWRMGV